MNDINYQYKLECRRMSRSERLCTSWQAAAVHWAVSLIPIQLKMVLNCRPIAPSGLPARAGVMAGGQHDDETKTKTHFLNLNILSTPDDPSTTF